MKGFGFLYQHKIPNWTGLNPKSATLTRAICSSFRCLTTLFVGSVIYQLRRKKGWKWIKGKREGGVDGKVGRKHKQGERGKMKTRDMKVQGQSCKDTLTMAHIHQAKRMMERGRRKGEGKGERSEIIAGTEKMSGNGATRHEQHQTFPLIIFCLLRVIKALNTVLLVTPTVFFNE